MIAGAGSLEKELRSRIAAKPYAEHVLLYGDMPHAATLRAMVECEVLLRTTLYDGDSVSVREALYIGIPVIASDNRMRPPGVRLFPTSNREGLRDAIFETLAGGDSPKNVPGDGQENIREVVEFYRTLLV
jgi:glycosyltransferase involved in cell wall biosynthesis